MRTSLFILFVSFSLSSFAQENLNDFLLVEKDSTSFYMFKKNGVEIFSFKNKKDLVSKFIPFENKVPKSLQSVSFGSLSAVTMNEEVYFLYPGGGILYKFSKNKFERIDQSFAHRNQFSGYFFAFKNELYLLGGYGYWTAKNSLTKFNFESGSWEIIPTIGVGPKKGINQGSFLKKKNTIVIFNFYGKKTESGQDIHNHNIFELDLKSFKWNKNGFLANLNESEISKSFFSTRINYNNSLFEKVFDADTFQITSLLNNTVNTYATEGKLSKLEKAAVFVGDNLVYVSKNAANTKNKLSFVNINDFKIIESNAFALNEKYLFIRYLLFAGISAFVFMFVLYGYFKTRKKIYFVNPFSLYNENASFLLKNKEFLLIHSFKNRKVLENNLILELYGDNTKSLDATVKRKNKIIEELNNKFRSTFGGELVLKKTDGEDLRQVFYEISKDIKLLFQD